MDFPGNTLEPGCTYERWVRRLAEGSEPAVYAHVVGDPGHPGKLAVQFWLFYAFNDWNNTHEGDWEMIQLVFDADDAQGALEQVPALVGYSSHEGAESADWGDDKLEIVDGTHPVVYPGAGSHANKYTEALYLGSSADAGVGCDDTRGPHDELRPAVKTIPSNPAAAREAFPWIVFEGRWGELQPAFFNGPTGPELEAAVDGADRVVARVAGPELRRADRRRVRHRSDRLLLRSRRGRLPSARPAPERSGRHPARPRGAPRRHRLGGHPDQVAAGRPATPGTATALRADPLGGRPHVPAATPPLHRDRPPVHPPEHRDVAPPGTPHRRLRPVRRGHTGESAGWLRSSRCSRSARCSHYSASVSSGRHRASPHGDRRGPEIDPIGAYRLALESSGRCSARS